MSPDPLGAGAIVRRHAAIQVIVIIVIILNGVPRRIDRDVQPVQRHASANELRLMAFVAASGMAGEPCKSRRSLSALQKRPDTRFDLSCSRPSHRLHCRTKSQNDSTHMSDDACLRHRSRRYIRPQDPKADNSVNSVVAAVSSHRVVEPP